MLVEEITPTEIGKHANVIKAAQEDLTVMDVLVCGRCFHVCHFIEDYQDHKEQSTCEANENLRKASDTKPGIWAFLLWKAAQLNNKKELASTSSWSLYQSWVKLEDSVRETWIVAGKTIQSFGKLGQGELQEMPVRITKTVVNNSNTEGSPSRKPSPQSKNALTTLKEAEQEKKTAMAATTLKQPNRIARRTLPGTNDTVAEKVEKIVAKRFNPRRKQHEYMVKWDGGEPLDNSWEPASNLEDVPHFLEVFEKQLARQKQTRAALNASKGLSNTNKQSESPTTPLRKLPNVSTAENVPVSSTGSPSRPPRTSKTKAMDQVKQWVNESTNAGSTSPSSATEEEVMPDNEKDWSLNSTNSPGGVSGIKRKVQDSDLNDSNASDSALGGTTSTMEDLEEDLIPSHTVKRLKNGSSISVEVKTKNEKNVEKVIKVNGTAGARSNTSVTGEVLQVGANSADVIITQDSSASGVMRKQGGSTTKPEKPEAPIRMLSKAESLVSNTGIVRASAVEDTKPVANTTIPARVQQIRSVAGVSSTTGRQTPTQAVQRQQVVTQTRTPGGTIIQRRTISTAQSPSPKPGVRVSQAPVRSNQHSTAGASGRLIIARTSGNTTPTPTRSLTTIGTKNVTPEEKIFNLSKSGDLKVTKKVMTREELRAAQQQRLQQQQRQPQTQVQIQKVQQIAPPRQRVAGTSTHVRTHTAIAAAQTSAVAASALPQEEEEHQAQLCPITGKLIGQEETQLQMEQEQQQEQQEQEQQQQLQALLGGDQQMLTNEDGSPLLVRGEDGTVYQVAGKNAEGQTILVTQGPDGEQQFAYVAAAEGEDNQVLTLDNAVAEAVAQLPAEALAAAASGESGQYLVQMTEEELVQHQAALQAQQEAGEATTQLTIQTGDGSDGQEANIPAEVVQADLPSPGGTRRVVLLLSDGNFMMTEMHDDEFKALNIAT